MGVRTDKEDLNVLSAAISDRTRMVAGGIIAVWWALVIGEDADGLASQLKGPVVSIFYICFINCSWPKLTY